MKISKRDYVNKELMKLHVADQISGIAGVIVLNDTSKVALFRAMMQVVKKQASEEYEKMYPSEKSKQVDAFPQETTEQASSNDKKKKS